jgi:peroxiredoxin
MSKVPLNKPAPTFELNDYHGQPIKLTEFQGKTNVVLIFNRGFT